LRARFYRAWLRWIRKQRQKQAYVQKKYPSNYGFLGYLSGKSCTFAIKEIYSIAQTQTLAASDHKMKIILIILFFCSIDCYGQSVTDILVKNKSLKKDNELILEIKAALNKIGDSLNIDMNNSNKLFIIRGVDIQDRIGYGTIWNSSNMFRYVDYKIWSDNRIIGPNPIIQTADKDKPDNIDDFKDLYILIEKWDKRGITKFVDSSPKVNSGIVNWTIIKITDNKADFINVRNFARLND